MANRITSILRAPFRRLQQSFDNEAAARDKVNQMLATTVPEATLRITGADHLIWNGRMIPHRGPEPYRTYRDGSIGLSQDEVLLPLAKMLRTQNRSQSARDVQRYAAALRTLQQAYGQRVAAADRTIDQVIGERAQSHRPVTGDVALGHPIERPHNEQHFAEFVGALGLNDSLHSAVIDAPVKPPLAAMNPYFIDAFTDRLAQRTGTDPQDLRGGLRRLDQGSRPAAVTDLIVRATSGAEAIRDSQVWRDVGNTLAQHLTTRPATGIRVPQAEGATAGRTAVDAAFAAAAQPREQPAEPTAAVTQDAAVRAGRDGVAEFGSTTAPQTAPDAEAARITAEGSARNVQR